MSDFLSRLAGRTMGLTPSVRPLVTPMYATHRSTPTGERSGLVPFDSDISGPVSPDQAFGRPQGHAPTDGFPDSSLMVQVGLHQEIEGDGALPLQEEYTETTHKNHPLSDDGSSSDHPFNAVSQHDLVAVPSSGSRKDIGFPHLPGGKVDTPNPNKSSGNALGLAPTFQADHPTSASFSVAHNDKASIVAKETTAHDRSVSLQSPDASDLLRRGAPLRSPDASDHLHRGAPLGSPDASDRTDEDHKNTQFAQHDHILPLNEPSQLNGSFPSSGEFSHAGISTPDFLSRQDHPSTRAGTSPRPYETTNGPSTRAETSPRPYETEHTVPQDWAALLPSQKGSGAEVSHLTGHSGSKHGKVGGITQHVQQNNIPPIETTTPSIQVTIGRIEVRATPPPTRSPAQRTAPSVMSLDDYVNQRMKGGG